MGSTAAGLVPSASSVVMARSKEPNPGPSAGGHILQGPEKSQAGTGLLKCRQDEELLQLDLPGFASKDGGANGTTAGDSQKGAAARLVEKGPYPSSKVGTGIETQGAYRHEIWISFHPALTADVGDDPSVGQFGQDGL